MRIVAFLLPFSWILLTFLGCRDMGSPPTALDEQIANLQSVALVDSALSAQVVYSNQSTSPDLDVVGNFTLSCQADSALIEYGSLLIQSRLLDSVVVSRRIYPLLSNTINVSRRVVQPIPFVEYPPVTLFLQITVYRQGSAKQQIIEARCPVRVTWGIPREPNVKPVIIPSTISVVNALIWKHDNSGFYFTASDGSVSARLYVCNVAGMSVRDVSFRTDAFRILDLSHDDKYLLVCDNNTLPSALYLCDLKNGNQTMLIPARDSLLVSSAAFSSDDNRIALTNIKMGPVIKDYPVYLFSRRDSSLVNLPRISGFLSTEIDCWLPNSNDEFAFRNRGSYFSFYSISQDFLSKIYFPTWHYPWKLLSDGNQIVGEYLTNIVGSGVNEIHLFLYTSDGLIERQLTFFPETLFEFGVSPDRKTLAFSGYRKEVWGLWIATI